MGAVEKVERPQRRRNLLIGAAIVAVLVLLAIATRSGGIGPGQQVRAAGPSKTLSDALTRPGRAGAADPSGSTTGQPGAFADPSATGPATGPAPGVTTPGSATTSPAAGGSANTTTTRASGAGADVLPGSTGGRSSGSGGTSGVSGGVDAGAGAGAGSGSATTTVTTTPTTTTTTTVAPGGNQLTISDLDTGKTYNVAKGSTLTLQFVGAWNTPISDAPAVKRTSAEGVAPFVFSADAAGAAHVTACRFTLSTCSTPDFSITVNVGN